MLCGQMQNKQKKTQRNFPFIYSSKSSKDEMILFECAYRAGETIRQIEELIIKKSEEVYYPWRVREG